MFQIKGTIGSCNECKRKKEKPILYVEIEIGPLNHFIRLCPFHVMRAIKKCIESEIEAERDNIPF